MSNKKFPQYALITFSSMLLTACGSGSSGSQAVADPPVANPPPVVVAEKVTLTGMVTDMPIANATVVITVNGVSFTAPNPTAADGSFEVEIESEDPDAMVLCEAFDPSGPARFSALLNNFAGMQESAGDDGVADDVNITNVTTAQFLLAQQQATDGTIDSLEELQAVAEQIDPEEMLELSAAIKVVVDSVEGVALPDDFADVQELAQAIVDGSTTFLEDIETVNPGILEETIVEVVSDGFATMEFKAGDVPGVYFDTDGNDVAVFFEDGSGYFAEDELFQDDSGAAYVNQIVEEVTWSVMDSGALEIVFTETQDVDTVVMLNDAGGLLTLHATSIENSGVLEVTDTFSVVRFGFDADGFAAASVPGSYRGEADEDDSETEFTVFQADGSGYDIDVATGEIDDFFTWEVSASGELSLQDDGVPDNGESEASDEREIVRLLEGSTADELIILAMEYEIDGDAVIQIEAFPVSYTAEILTGPEPDMANTAVLEGKTFAYADGDDRGIVTFGANGVFSDINQDFDEFDGPEFEEETGEWFIDDGGTIHVTFVDTDGTVDADSAEVVSGLGEDRMVLLTEDDADGIDDELVLHRIVSFEAAEIVGSWSVVEEGFDGSYTVTFDADGTGAYFEDGVLDDAFTWDVDAGGKVVVTLDDAGTDVFTDNIHKAADSTSDSLHAFVVFRRNGALDNDSDDAQGPPLVVAEWELVRQF